MRRGRRFVAQIRAGSGLDADVIATHAILMTRATILPLAVCACPSQAFGGIRAERYEYGVSSTSKKRGAVPVAEALRCG